MHSITVLEWFFQKKIKQNCRTILLETYDSGQLFMNIGENFKVTVLATKDENWYWICKDMIFSGSQSGSFNDLDLFQRSRTFCESFLSWNPWWAAVPPRKVAWKVLQTWILVQYSTARLLCNFIYLPSISTSKILTGRKVFYIIAFL